MTGFLWAVLGILGGLAMTAIGDMVSEEVRDRLDHLPHAILRLAAWRLDSAQRVTMYDDEWMPELTYILKGDEARPITRLYHGTRYALGILCGVRGIVSQLDPAVSDTAMRFPSPQGTAPVWSIVSAPGGGGISLRIPSVSAADIGDEFTLNVGASTETYEVIGVVDDHEWSVRRVNDRDAGSTSQP